MHFPLARKMTHYISWPPSQELHLLSESKTYYYEFVDEKLFAGHLDAGVYRVKVSADSKASSFEAYHHLSFESLEIIKVEGQTKRL
jgi:hypothetical protein